MRARQRSTVGRVVGTMLVVVLLSGCVGRNWGTQGVPFFPVTDDMRASLEEFKQLEAFLAGKIGDWSLAEVEDHIVKISHTVREAGDFPEPLPERHASVNGKQTVVSRVWRFTTLDRFTLSVPTIGHRQGRRVGFVLQADENAGKLARVQTSFTYLTDKERDFSTKPLVAGALAAAGTFILLSAD
jgi:hypothetical protein